MSTLEHIRETNARVPHRRATEAYPTIAGRFVDDGPLDHEISCEVLVVGGGVSGAFAAQQLAEAGVDVVLVDRAAPASGSTAQSTALVQYEPDVPLVDLIPTLGLANAQAVYRQTDTALSALRQLIDRYSLDCDLTERSTLFLARTADDLPQLQHESIAREQIGLSARFIDADGLAAIGIQRPGAIRSPRAYELNPSKLTFALLAQAQADGARVYCHTPVRSDPWVGGLPAMRTQTGHNIHCQHVVHATGYGALADYPALRSLCQMRTTFAAFVRPENDGAGSRWWHGERPMLWELGDPYFYARSTPDGRLLIGGEDEALLPPDRREAVLASKTERLLEQLFQITGVQAAKVDHAFGATFVQTVDGLPFIGSPDASDRCFFALGYGGNGILFSLIAAQVFRDRLGGKDHPAAGLFGFHRQPVAEQVLSDEMNCP